MAAEEELLLYLSSSSLFSSSPVLRLRDFCLSIRNLLLQALNFSSSFARFLSLHSQSATSVWILNWVSVSAIIVERVYICLCEREGDKEGFVLMVMSCGGGGEEKLWTCGKAGVANLQRVGSIVRDIGDLCLSQTPIKVVIAVSRMLKPDKWQATFDSNGKVFGFRKVLKLIILGGVEPSIRPEVWEFLLGCYALGSTAEYRRQLRSARRERYNDLIKQCQLMHSSIGTGSLAYVVRSKVMDMRTGSKDDGEREVKVESGQSSVDNTNKKESYRDWKNNCTDMSYICERESSSDSADLLSLRGSTDGGGYDSSCFLPSLGLQSPSSPKREIEAQGSQYICQSFFDFPPLPVTDLFEKSTNENPSKHQKLRFEDDAVHTFQINNNIDLVIESNGSQSNNVSCQMDSEIEMVRPDSSATVLQSNSLAYQTEVVNTLRMSDARDSTFGNATCQPAAISEDRVSEWLWTLHRIVVDVVRTDSHLEFYEDMKNLARMSDILAVYAWVDPATGYCQGCNILVSHF
ncbi:small G protein signaling modulator 1 [Tripterygium wilfordii]|uniref:Small G protein signaling modulator 1 n=1 Tax=Tripterygium wilfordii TaxID=458696 RepID=A0A7J7C3U5_TRIWF|nr:small G protein signaling modulator 1 [Tripterygium wilfordii]